MINKEEFYFDSRDGEHKIHAIKWVPEAKKPVCILQIVHGMSEYIDRYDDFANYLADRGYSGGGRRSLRAWEVREAG